jgi:glycosyltransferase involved in cell wall biosynthesis
MKRVLIIGARAPENDHGVLVGGSQKVPYKIFKSLSKRNDINVSFWHFDGRKTEKLSEALEAKIEKVSTLPAKLYLKTLVREMALLLRIKSLQKYEIIQIHHPHYALAIGILKKLSIINAKVIVKAHGTAIPENESQKHKKIKYFIYGINSELHKFHDRLSLKFADKIIVSSIYQIEEMSKIYKVPKEKIVVIYNGYDADYFRKIERRKKIKVPRLLFIGRIVKKKNALYAIALKKYLDSLYNEPVKLTIIAGERNRIEDGAVYRTILDETTNMKSIQLLHDLNETELSQQCNESSILLVPSQSYESIPSVIYEGLASNNYVLATKRWGIPEILLDSLYLTHTIKEDAKIIMDITKNNLKNPVDVSKYSYNRLAEQYMELYRYES